MSILDLPTLDVESVTLGYVLKSLAASGNYPCACAPGLPGKTIYVDRRGVMLSITTAETPEGRDALATLARKMHYDGALLRVSQVAGGLTYVTADVTLGLLPCQPWSIANLALWAGPDDELWLVAEGFGASISITADGLSAELVPPFETYEDRASGIFRAAGQLADLLRPVGAD